MQNVRILIDAPGFRVLGYQIVPEESPFWGVRDIPSSANGRTSPMSVVRFSNPGSEKVPPSPTSDSIKVDALSAFFRGELN